MRCTSCQKFTKWELRERRCTTADKIAPKTAKNARSHKLVERIGIIKSI